MVASHPPVVNRWIARLKGAIDKGELNVSRIVCPDIKIPYGEGTSLISEKTYYLSIEGLKRFANSIGQEPKFLSSLIHRNGKDNLYSNEELAEKGKRAAPTVEADPDRVLVGKAESGPLRSEIKSEPVFSRDIIEEAGMENSFVCEGDFWSIKYNGESSHLKNLERIRYIVHLLENADKPISVFDLYNLLKDAIV
jgi:hypothetical protein